MPRTGTFHYFINLLLLYLLSVKRTEVSGSPGEGELEDSGTAATGCLSEPHFFTTGGARASTVMAGRSDELRVDGDRLSPLDEGERLAAFLFRRRMYQPG